MCRQILLLVLFCCFRVAISQENEPCKLFFTVQPPRSIPCNPYHTTLNSDATRFALQCTAHAPKLNMYQQELNFTIEWVKEAVTSAQGHTPRAMEEVVNVVSSSPGLQVENKVSTYSYGQSESFIGVYVNSVLSFDPSSIPNAIEGRYWCRVLVKTLDDYSYSVAGRSNTETTLLSSDGYLPQQPPCVGDTKFHETRFKCVQDESIVTLSDSDDVGSMGPPLPPPAHDSGSVAIPTGALAAIVVTGGALVVAVLILILIVVYSCRMANAWRNMEESGGHRNRISVQSTETQEEECGVSHANSSKPHPLNFKPSLGRHNNSYRMKTEQLPQHNGSQRKNKSNANERRMNGSATSFL